jgi:hypothetical protein
MNEGQVLRTVAIFVFMVFVGLTSYGMGYTTGYQTAGKVAYDTKNVSQGLEMACLSLWVTQRNFDYAGRTE